MADTTRDAPDERVIPQVDGASGQAEPVRPIRSQDVLKTYRYLRIGMFGAVIFLAVSIAVERSKVDCLQTSISAYYYTPVRAVFVGSR